MRKKWISLLLSASLLLGAAVPAAFAADISGHWAESYIEYLNDEGVYKPSAATGNFEPERAMTRAEFMRYINRAFHFTEKDTISFSDVKSSSWYYETVQIAVHYGYISGVGNGLMNPEGTMTREQAAVIIGRLFRADATGVKPTDLGFADNEKIGEWSAGYIKDAVGKGFLSGYTDGTFQPQRVVTRAEVAKLLYQYLGTSFSTAGSRYTGYDLKTDTQNATISESCTLTDATIPGDLYVTEGCGKDAVTLDRVTVSGTLILAGGTTTLNNVTCDKIIRV